MKLFSTKKIRSGLQADGGDIEVIDFEDNILKILYVGSLRWMPAAAMTGTLNAIQGILRNELSNDSLLVIPV